MKKMDVCRSHLSYWWRDCFYHYWPTLVLLDQSELKLHKFGVRTTKCCSLTAARTFPLPVFNTRAIDGHVLRIEKERIKGRVIENI